MWLDVGNDLTEGPSGPWLDPHHRSYSWATTAYPTIQYKPNMALQARIPASRSNSDEGRPRKFRQSASLMYLNYGRTQDPAMACDPFHALTELFKFTAFSEVQFLNMMETKLKKETDFSVIDSRHSPTLSNLLYSKKILDNHAQYIEETIAFLKGRGTSDWQDIQSQNSDSPDRQPTTGKEQPFLQDFEYLFERAKMLSDYCDRGMNIVMNNSMLAESQRAIQQAAGVEKLTRLAFFYIPLSFTTSFFGMNFVQFAAGNYLSIWAWFALSAPVLLISILLMTWDISAFSKSLLFWWKALWNRKA